MAAAIAYHPAKRSFVSPTEHKTVRLLLESVKKNYAKPAVQRRPFTTPIPQAVREEVACSERLWKWRTLWRMYMGYVIMLCCGGTSPPTFVWKTYNLNENTWTFTFAVLKQWKAIMYELTGSYMHRDIARLAITETYIAKLCYQNGCETQFLQPRIRVTINGESGIAGTRLAYGNAMADLKRLLSHAGIDPTLYGKHSGRRGGATAAASAGISWLDLKRHGRWKSDTAPQAYIDKNEGNKYKAAEVLSSRALTSTLADTGNEPSGRFVQPPSTEARSKIRAARKDSTRGWSPWTR